MGRSLLVSCVLRRTIRAATWSLACLTNLMTLLQMLPVVLRLPLTADRRGPRSWVSAPVKARWAGLSGRSIMRAAGTGTVRLRICTVG